MTKLNYGILVDPNKKYKVYYTINSEGQRIFKDTELLGSDLTENQIKEVILKEILSNIHK